MKRITPRFAMLYALAVTIVSVIGLGQFGYLTPEPVSIPFVRNADAFAFSRGSSGTFNPPSSCTGTNYYVASGAHGGNDSNNGKSTGAPWLTIAHANIAGSYTGSSITAGQCLNFNGGDSFTGCLAMIQGGNVTASSAGNPIIIQSYGAGQASIVSNCAGSQTSAVLLDDISGVTFQNLIVSSGGTFTQFGILVQNSKSASASSTTLIQNNTVSGFSILNGVNGSTASEIMYIGFALNGNQGPISNVSILNNTLFGPNGASLSQDDAGIQGYGFGTNVTNLTVSGNTVFNMGSIAGHPPGGGEGILIDGVNGGTVTHNLVHDIGANQNTCGGPSGIETYSSTNVTVAYNEVYNVQPSSHATPGATAGCDWDAFDIDGDSVGVIMEYNYSHNNYGAGYLAWVGSNTSATTWGPNTIRYNISEADAFNVTDLSVGSIWVSGNGEPATSTLNIYNNDVYQNNPGTSTSRPSALAMMTAPTAGIVANNAFAVKPDATTGCSGGHCYTFNSFNAIAYPGITFKSNGYSTISGSGTFNMSNYGSSGQQLSLIAWQTAVVGEDTGATTASPLFVGSQPAGTCVWTPVNQTGPQSCPTAYQLTSLSPYLGVGTNLTQGPYNLNVGVSDYFLNPTPNLEGTGYDIGAYTGPQATYVSSVTISPSTGLLTSSGSSGAGNTATVTLHFAGAAGSVAVTGTPTITLTNGTVCSYSSGTGTLALAFACSITAGQNTPTALSSTNPGGYATFINTNASGAVALPSATIIGAGNNALLASASNVPFVGLSANTAAAYFISPSGTDTGSGTGACQFSAPCQTLNFVKGLMELNSTKTTYLLAGTYTPASTCSFTTVNGGFTATTVLCLTAASDNGTSYLGYPNASGPAGVTVTGGATNVSNGVNAFAEVGVCCSRTVSNVTFNGFQVQNFSMEGLHIWYTGGLMTVSNMSLKNFFTTTATYTGGGGISTGQAWDLIYIGHNTLNTCGEMCITGPNSSTGSAGQQAGGGVTVDGNIVLNWCNANNDCGGIYEFDESHTVSATWSNNIVGSGGNGLPAAGGAGKWFYMDDYTSNIAGTNNQAYGNAQMGLQIHGGGNNVWSYNFFDMSVISTACPGASCSDNATFGYYQQSTLAPTNVNGYAGTMAGNQFNHTIMINTGATAPPAFMWVWSENGAANYPPQFNPTFTGNDYYSAVGSWNSCANGLVGGGSTNCEFNDPTAVTTNPGANFTTGSWGERHYTFTNPPVGFQALRTDQGAH